MRPTTALWLTMASIVALWAAVSIPAAENRGAEQITLSGGNRGNIAFPHHLHQSRIADCNACHATFPQQAGAIDDMKRDGKLAPKQVMTKLCIKCHRDKKAAGEESGPTACNECHRKS